MLSMINLLEVFKQNLEQGMNVNRQLKTNITTQISSSSSSLSANISPQVELIWRLTQWRWRKIILTLKIVGIVT